MIKYNGIKVVILGREWNYASHSNDYLIRVDDPSHEFYGREFIVNEREIGWQQV